MVTAYESAIVEALRVLRVHGIKPKANHQVVGGNFRLDARLPACALRSSTAAEAGTPHIVPIDMSEIKHE